MAVKVGMAIGTRRNRGIVSRAGAETAAARAVFRIISTKKGILEWLVFFAVRASRLLKFAEILRLCGNTLVNEQLINRLNFNHV